MRDVDHTPRDGESANRVFERGAEHRGEDVVAADLKPGTTTEATPSDDEDMTLSGHETR